MKLFFLQTPKHAKLSRHLSWVLDMQGYSPLQRQIRQNYYKKMDTLKNSQDPQHTQITVGSKGEGLTSIYESDTDILIIPNNVVVVDDLKAKGDYPRDIKVLQMNNRLSYPGHCLLLLTGEGPRADEWESKGIMDFGNGVKLLTNRVISMASVNIPSTVERQRSGPSTMFVVDEAPMDIVISFRCKTPSFIRHWVKRQREYGWPPEEVIREISEMEVNLVGTGFTGSETKDVEWRVCFNPIEVLLMTSLNDTQTKLYVLLKMVLKTILKPQQKELTSYDMKNLVLWMAEMNPQVVFYEESLVDWLFKCLRLLKRSIQQGCIPYYMIPERNLLAGKMKQCQKERLLRRMSAVIKRGPSSLLKCPKLYNALVVVEPKQLYWLGKRRDLLEVLELICKCRAVEYETSARDINDDIDFIEKLLFTKLQISVPNFTELTMQGIDIMSLSNETIRRILQ